MKTRILLTLGSAIGLLSLAYAYVQPEGPRPSGAEAAIKAASQSYAEAFSKGDLAGVLAIWSPNAEYIDAEGEVTQGKDALTARFKATLAEMKGWTMKLEGKSLRLLTPTVAVADGSAELTSPDGDKETSAYTTIWTLADGRWLLSSVRDLTPPPPPAVDGAEMLKELDWLVGDWNHEDEAAKVTLTCKRTLNRFLVFDYTIKTAAGSQEVRQYVGFDPRDENLRSWIFDSAGGFGDGQWSKRGKVWRCRTVGVLPDGGDGEATNSLKQVDANSFIWKSVDRFVGDAAMPDTEIKFTRAAK